MIREIHKDKGLVCRYGGEEFCVLLPQFELDQAIAEGEKTRAAISQIRLLDPAELRLTGSIGLSDLRFDADRPARIGQPSGCVPVRCQTRGSQPSDRVQQKHGDATPLADVEGRQVRTIRYSVSSCHCLGDGAFVP